MSQNQKIPIFPLLKQKQIDQINNKKVLASCAFACHVHKQDIEQEAEIVLKNIKRKKRQNIINIVQIRQNYVIQINNQKQIISGFQATFDTKFQPIKINQNSQNIIQGLRILIESTRRIQISIICISQIQFQPFLHEWYKLLLIQSKFDKQNHYLIIRQLGKGSNAKVFQAFDKQKNKKVAIRGFKKSKIKDNQLHKYNNNFIQQVKIIRQLGEFEGFCKLHTIYQTEGSIYMIMDVYPRNLQAHIYKYGYVEFQQCRKLMYKLAKILQVMHKKHIIHRDIKLQNIMVQDQQAFPIRPILIDFGLVKKSEQKIQSNNICGTFGYIAPQILSGCKFDEKCDIFAMGVVFYYLLVGVNIFQANSLDQVKQNNIKCQTESKINERIPQSQKQAKQLLKLMLQKNPDLRISADQILVHDFFKNIRI